jgi:DNA-directed RNA polymerase
MPTPAQIDEQIQLERDQIRLGLKRLRDNTRKLEEQSYASATVYGVSSIEAILPQLVERIEDTANRIHEGKTGVAFREIRQYLTDIEPMAAAAIALKITFDKVFSVKPGNDHLVEVTKSIGAAIEAECQMRHYERTAPGLLNCLKTNYWHRSIGTHQKLVVIKTLMNRCQIEEWHNWGNVNRVKLGGWLLDCIIQVSEWFTKEVVREGRKTKNVVIPTAKFLAVKDKVISDSELFAPLTWPMLIEPNDWTNERPGGYILNEVMRGHDLVRRGDPTLIQGEAPLAFLNKIQKVAFRLNPFIVEVSEELERRQRPVGKFRPIVHHELPPKPVDIADNYDSRKDYRRRAAEVMNRNAQEFKRSCRTRMTLEAVQRFKNVQRFWIPWSFDYRGRAYPIPAFLTPQDTDWGKSLLRFADESFMTPEAEGWMSFMCATCYGLDKATMAERLEWTAHNHELIQRVATDPLGTVHEWEVASEPWQFLAACEEFYHCVIAADRNFTGLMVATDATCSGLQILSGLCRCKSTAEMVNVIPSSKPQDAYKVVAEAATPNCPASIREHMDRKVTKRTCLTIPYNAKPYSNRSYIREALAEKGVEVSKEELTQTVAAVRAAMEKIFPGPMRVMRWIEEEVSNAIKRGADQLQWTTPSGFVVNQKLMKKNVVRVELQLLGDCKMFVANGDTDKVDLNHHKNATSPNLIHSLDSCLLHLSTLRFDAPIALIHDSVLCRATDMSDLSTLVRETYMHLFAEHDYLRDFAQQIGAETEPPIIGDLEPASVIESTYFFC